MPRVAAVPEAVALSVAVDTARVLVAVVAVRAVTQSQAGLAVLLVARAAVEKLVWVEFPARAGASPSEGL